MTKAPGIVGTERFEGCRGPSVRCSVRSSPAASRANPLTWWNVMVGGTDSSCRAVIASTRGRTQVVKRGARLLRVHQGDRHHELAVLAAHRVSARLEASLPRPPDPSRTPRRRCPRRNATAEQERGSPCPAVTADRCGHAACGSPQGRNSTGRAAALSQHGHASSQRLHDGHYAGKRCPCSRPQKSAPTAVTGNSGRRNHPAGHRNGLGVDRASRHTGASPARGQASCCRPCRRHRLAAPLTVT